MKKDPTNYYRELAVLFITYAAAFRGITEEEYINGFNAGRFNYTGEELVPVDTPGISRSLSQKQRVALENTPAFQFARIHGELGLNQLWKMAEIEGILFDDETGPRS